MLNRRTFLSLTGAATLLPALPVLADDRLFYTPGVAEAAMDEGRVVFLDFWTNWCSTCAAQERTISALRAAKPAYDKGILFITVDWDQFGDGELARGLKIPRRSTLVALQGRKELGRIVAGTSKAEIAALMDAALAAAGAG